VTTLDNLDHPGIEVAGEAGTFEAYAEAARVAARLLPRFTDIVRTSAGDPGIRVCLNTSGLGPCTDGDTIHLPVWPSFAGVDPDNPCVCDDDPDRCLYHINVGFLLHEAAHISQGSTKPVDKEFFDLLYTGIQDLLEVLPPEFKEKFEVNCYEGLVPITDPDARSAGPRPLSALEVASWFNPEAPFIANAFEDARINKAVGDSRSALGQQMERLVHELIARAATGEGINEGAVGYQVGVAVEVELEHGYDLKPTLKSSTVLACLNDPVVAKIIKVGEPKSTAGSVAAAVVLTEYARETYGLFEHRRPESDEDDSEDGSRTGSGRAASKTMQSGKDMESDGKLKESQRLRDKKTMEEARNNMQRRASRTANAESEGRTEYRANRGVSDPGEVDAPGMAEIAEAMNAARAGEESETLSELMQLPGGSGMVGDSGEGEYVVVVLRPNYSKRMVSSKIKLLPGWKYPAEGGFDEASRLEVDVQGQIHGAQRKLADALGLNRRSASVPNLVRGRLHGSKLARVPTGNRRAFRRIEKPRKRSYAVLIGVDQSGSTDGEAIKQLRQLAYAQATLLDKLGIPFAVSGHTGSSYYFDETDMEDDEGLREDIARDLDSSLTRRSLMTLQLVKNFAEPWDQTAKSGLGALHSSHQNLDGLTMRTYVNLLCTQRATDRILLYYTDGQMPAEDFTNQRAILEAQCRRVKAMAQLPDRRLHVVGIGLGCDDPKQYGLDTIEVPFGEPDEGVHKVVDGLAERIARTING